MILRIDFDENGQDFTWWDVDAHTGRVVGCGPFQAWIWTKYSVVLDTVAVGSYPIAYKQSPRIDGVRLRHAVVRVGAAEPAAVQP